MAQEQRTTPRLSVSLPVDLCHMDLHASGRVDDITPEGVFIETSEGYEIGSKIEIEFHFDESKPRLDIGPNMVTLQGEVMWKGTKVRKYDRKVVSGVGVKFVNIKAETFDLVVALYERLSTTLVS